MEVRQKGRVVEISECSNQDRIKIIPPASMTGLGIMIEFDEKTGKAIITGSSAVIAQIVAPGVPTIS